MLPTEGSGKPNCSAGNVQSAASAKTAAEKKQADLQAAAAASLQREAAAIPAGTPAEAAVSSPSVAEAVPAGETGGAAPPVSPEPTYPIEPGAPGAYLTDMPDGTPVHIGDTVTWESSSAQYRGVVTGLLPSGKLAVERIEPGLQPGQRGPVSKRPLTGVQKVLTFAGEDVTPAAVVDEVAPESVVASTEEPATAVGQISPESAAPQVAADAEPAIQPAEPARLIPEPATPQGPVRASGEPAMRTKTQQFRDMGGKRLSIGDPLFAVTSKSRLNIVGAPANAASADGVVTGVTAMPRGGNMLEVRWTFYDKDGKAIGNPLDRTHDNQDVVTAMELRKGRAGPETVSPAKPVAPAMGSLSNPQVGDVIVRTVQVPGRPGHRARYAWSSLRLVRTAA